MLIARWRQAGRLVRVHAGVYAVGYRRVEPVAIAMAAVLACGDRALLEPRLGRRVVGLATLAADARGHEHAREAPAGHRTHRTRSLPRGDRDWQLGVPVTSPERTIREIESRLTRKQFTRIVKEASLQRRLDDAAVTRLLGYAAEPTRSEFEEAFRRFCRRFGLPSAQTLVTRARIRGRRAVRRTTSRHRAGRLGVPSGVGWRSATTASATPNCLDFGYETVRITWERLHETPEREAARLHRILARRVRELEAQLS